MKGLEKFYKAHPQPKRYFTRAAVGFTLGFALSRLFRTSLRTQLISGAIGVAAAIALPKYSHSPKKRRAKPAFRLKKCTPKNLKEFATKVFEEQEGNTVFSPLSLWLLLRQVNHGAASYIQETLKFVIGEDELRPGHIKSLHLHLQNDELKLANLCLHKYELQPTFKNQLDAYGPEYGKLSDDSAAEVKRVNGWVKKNTNGLIPTILNPDEITPQTVAVLANAVAFTGKWQSKFEKTEDETFGNVDLVPMMKQTNDFLYWKNDKFEFLKVFYIGKTFSRIFMLPVGEAETLKEAMAQDLQPPVDTHNQKVKFWLPKNKCEQEIDVLELLNQIAPVLGFTLKNGNSLPKMLETKNPVSLGLCRHKATLEDDEAGTKASAATVAVVREKYVPQAPVQFLCNRPYAHVLLHEKSQMPIFVGQVMTVNAGQ